MNSNINGSKESTVRLFGPGSASKMGLLGNSRDMQSLAAWLLPVSDAVANFVMRTRYGLTEFKAMSETKMNF